ncbi:MAG TPA: phosphoribosylglycinamide synthetase C domain-containing protein, partial [Trebonia sp.]
PLPGRKRAARGAAGRRRGSTAAMSGCWPTAPPAGGRVLNAVGSGPDLAAARAAAYAVAETVRFRGAWYRHDIAEHAAAL